MNRLRDRLSACLFSYIYNAKALECLDIIGIPNRKIREQKGERRTMKQVDFNIFLIGFMGCGKSTIAKALQDKLGMDIMEMDTEIVKRQGMSIAEIFEKHGETYFRDVESNLLKELKSEDHVIVSCGGGVVIRSENSDYMKKSGKVVLLTATPETVYERVKDSKDRPILNQDMSVAHIANLMEKRRLMYQNAAEVTIQTDGKTAEAIADEIIEKITE